MTGRPLLGAMLAVIVECAHWARLRWDFNDEACARAWQLSTIAIFLAGTLIYLEGQPRLALSNLLTWMPALLLPMQFIQSYGMRDSMPLNTFSFLAKHRRQRNIRLGLSETVVFINFGNIYFVTALIGATLGNQSSGPYAWLFLPGMIVLTGWMLLSSSRSRPASLLIALVIAGLIAIGGQKALEELDDRLSSSGSSGQTGFNPNWTSTLVGKRRPIEQSPEIMWRLRPSENKPPPLLLRTASYNTYNENGSWAGQPILNPAFKDLDTRLQDGEAYLLLSQEATEAEQIRSVSKQLRRFTLRGSAAAETPLPLPGDTSSLKNFELDGIERNSFGTVHVFPKHSVIEGTVLWQGDDGTENPYPLKEDLQVPAYEVATLKAVLRQLHLMPPTLPEAYRARDHFLPLDRITSRNPIARYELPLHQRYSLQQKLAILRGWFAEHFRYSRVMTIDIQASRSIRPTAIEQFLTTTRTGHCEYFATATALLLRETGIPARYAIGYAVMERDPAHKEYVVRGTHGHAWCRVWDAAAAKWIDFDTTPGGWAAIVAQQNTATQRFYDALKRMREDFFLWRNEPSNRSAVTLVMSAIAIGVASFIIKRLWKSKRRMEADRRANGYTGPVVRTALNAIEPQAAKRLGPRPPGQPFAEWLLRLRPTLPDAGTLDEAITLHQRLRFDPDPAAPGEQERLEELAKQLDAEIKR